jgi:hypothetical protein
MGHDKRVGAEVIKDMAVQGDAIDVHDLGQQFGEDPVGVRRRGTGSVLKY